MDFLDILLLFIRALLKVTKVTTEHQKWTKMDQNSIKVLFLAKEQKKTLAKGQSLPQELEVSLRSGPYLLVWLKLGG